MNEIFFYTGMVFAIGSLIVSFVFFFSLNIPEAVRYYIRPASHMNKRGPVKGNRTKGEPKKKQQNSKSALKPERETGLRKKTNNKSNKQAKTPIDATEHLYDATETDLLNSMKNQTEMLSIAQNYATAILDADETTEILTEWNSQTEHE